MLLLHRLVILAIDKRVAQLAAIERDMVHEYGRQPLLEFRADAVELHRRRHVAAHARVVERNEVDAVDDPRRDRDVVREEPPHTPPHRLALVPVRRLLPPVSDALMVAGGEQDVGAGECLMGELKVGLALIVYEVAGVEDG